MQINSILEQLLGMAVEEQQAAPAGEHLIISTHMPNHIILHE